MSHLNSAKSRIFCIGETVLDLIFQQGELKGARAGGSVLNAACTLAAHDLPVYLISECGQDPAGDLICDFLDSQGIATNYMYRYAGAPTALVQAKLCESGQPTYTFSKNYPSQRLQLTEFPVFNTGDIVLFGSGAALDEGLRPNFVRLLVAAREAGALLIYDPNLRPAYRAKLEANWILFEENLSLAHLVKASSEDLQIAFETTNIQEQFDQVQKFGTILIRTDAHRPVQMMTQNQGTLFPVTEVSVVSAIGAGDNFNAGLTYMFYQRNLQAQNLAELNYDQWQEIISYGQKLAAVVCQSLNNSLFKEDLMR